MAQPPVDQRDIAGHPHHLRAHDASNGIALGGVAQPITVAPWRGYEVINVDATLDLWISDNGVTPGPNKVGSIRVPPNGGAYWTPTSMTPSNQLLQVWGASTGQAYTARYW